MPSSTLTVQHTAGLSSKGYLSFCVCFRCSNESVWHSESGKQDMKITQVITLNCNTKHTVGTVVFVQVQSWWCKWISNGTFILVIFCWCSKHTCSCQVWCSHTTDYYVNMYINVISTCLFHLLQSASLLKQVIFAPCHFVQSCRQLKQAVFSHLQLYHYHISHHTFNCATGYCCELTAYGGRNETLYISLKRETWSVHTNISVCLYFHAVFSELNEITAAFKTENWCHQLLLMPVPDTPADDVFPPTAMWGIHLVKAIF